MIMESDLQSVKQQTERLIAEKEVRQRDLRRIRTKLKSERKHLKNTEFARSIIQFAAQKTQENLQFHISKLVSSALYSVFPQPYDFRVEFIQRRNSTECDLMFHRDGNFVEPEFASGGGPLDVASFASRVSQLTLEKTRPVVILDEPFKYLSRSLINNACEMLTALKKELGIQFIIVTHIQDLIKAGDKVFEVSGGEVSEWTSSRS